jgi:spoIIIJ-associated protein
MTIQEYLVKTFKFLGYDESQVEINLEDQEQRTRVNLVVPKDIANCLIGSQGQGIQSLQHLIRITFNKKEDEKKVILDINNQLEEKEKQFVEDIKKAALQVLNTKQEKVYRRLNSYERYLVHSTVSQDKELSSLATYSTTVGLQRWLTICFAKDVPGELKQRSDKREDFEQ